MVLVLAVSLALDTWPGGWAGQLAGSLLMWAAFLTLAHRADPAGRRMLLKCLAFATAGELFFSLVWGLYDYRLGAVPLFVPPGHVLMLLTGMALARRLGDAAASRIAGLTFAALAVACVATRDGLSAPLLAVFVLLWRASPQQRPVYAVMMLLALVLELYGTWLACWAWRPVAPWLQLPAHNPPLAAGAFYCALDWTVLAVRSAAIKAGWSQLRRTFASCAPPFQPSRLP